MDDQDFLARQFEEHRSHLRAVSYRMLGPTPKPKMPSRMRGFGSVALGSRELRTSADG